MSHQNHDTFISLAGMPFTSAILFSSFKNRHQPCQHLVHDRIGNAFQFLSKARADVKRPRLIATDNSRRFGSSAQERHGKTGGSCEVPSACDRENHGHFRHPVECLRRHDQDRTAAFLSVSHRGVKFNKPDFTTLHQRSSLPTGLSSSHSRSSLFCGILESHWASNSSRE